MRGKPYVYVAGPITSSGDYLPNLLKGLATCAALTRSGIVPFVPFTHDVFHMLAQHTYSDILAFDLAWLQRCNIVLRLPGQSRGADLETRMAKRLQIPVVYSIEELLELVKERRKADGHASKSVGFTGGTSQGRERPHGEESR